MVIDLSIIILSIAILGANLIVLVKIFNKDAEDDEEVKETEKKFPIVSKSWEEPMDNKHKELLDNDRYDLKNKIVTENTCAHNKKIATNSLISTENADPQNEKIAKDKNKKELSIKKNEYSVEITENKIEENEDFNKQKILERTTNENSVTEIIIEGKVYELSLKDNIIFTYNNENYSSYVLEIKHDNVKIKYRSQEKWINFSDIEKIL